MPLQPGGTPSAYFPFVSVVTPVNPPSGCSSTPATGAPLVSVTAPEMAGSEMVKVPAYAYPSGRPKMFEMAVAAWMDNCPKNFERES